MGKGSNDPLVNRLMPRHAVVNIPDALDIAESQQCRDEAELLACENIQRSIDWMLSDLTRQRRKLREAKRIIEAKIKTYKEEL